MLRLLLIGVLLLAGIWLIATLYLPYADASPQDLSMALNARANLSSSVMAQVPTAQIRLEQKGGFNLTVWMSDFESVLYPDRKQFLQTVGQLWCEDKDIGGGLVFLPSVEVRDIKDGKKLASYSCALSSASVD